MQGWPVAQADQTVGLLGGSFDPAHAGHVNITLAALRRFRLEHIWWLVSPGNPLKHHGPAPLKARLKAAHDIMTHPRVTVTDLESRLGTRFTAQTLKALKARYPGVRFVWLMGADNLAQFDQWQDWRWIMDHVPVGVLARPNDRISARFSKAARIYHASRLKGQAASLLARSEPPAWCFVNLPLSTASSSAIRAQGHWVRAGETVMANELSCHHQDG